PRPAMPRPAPRPVRTWDEDEEVLSEENEISPRRRGRSGGSKTLFFALLLLAPLVGGGYYFYGQYTAKRNREVKLNLEKASAELKHDSYASYQKACDYASAALDLDPSSVAAHGYLAYAWAIRWGEHGGGDEARKQAEEHLAQAKQGHELSSQLYAAEALIKTYGGRGKEALAELDARVKQFEAEGKHSSLLSLTLGLIQMNAGDLEAAKSSLEKAQSLAPDDPRVYAALGTLYRRLGQDNTAWKNYDFALRYERNHPESQLGKALLMLEQENAQYYVGAAKMIQALIEADPPPSPRQLATAKLARAFLVSRISNEVGHYKPEDQKQLLEGAHVPADKKAAEAEIAKAEDEGFTLDKTNPELHLIKGRRLFLEGQIDPAVEEIRTAVKMDPTRAQFYVELARALMAKKGGEKEAQEALETAIRTMGNSPKLVLMLGQAYQRQGQLDKAIAQFELAVGDGKQKAPEAKLALGAALREKKDYAKAIDLLTKAAQEFVGQDDRIAAAYTELARALEEKGDREKAGETYQQALKADADYAPSYYFFARYLAADKANAAKAKIAAQEYLRREPKGEYSEAAQRLAQ
ncbi:MAG: tetratricopeptide repeat protein, partial [Myxococcaceae bacterium]|nr:tetratricopeptide repeat protein [Myxococcaceae bacterium]